MEYYIAGWYENGKSEQINSDDINEVLDQFGKYIDEHPDSFATFQLYWGKTYCPIVITYASRKYHDCRASNPEIRHGLTKEEWKAVSDFFRKREVYDA